MTESEYQILLAAIVEASDVRYDAAKVVLTKLMASNPLHDVEVALREASQCYLWKNQEDWVVEVTLDTLRSKWASR